MELTSRVFEALEVITGKIVFLPEETYSAFNVSLPPIGKQSYSWKELGTYYYDQIKSTLKSSPAMENISEAWVGDSWADYVDQAFEWVKLKIRYLADEKGRHGYIPRFLNRSGCRNSRQPCPFRPPAGEWYPRSPHRSRHPQRLPTSRRPQL